MTHDDPQITRNVSQKVQKLYKKLFRNAPQYCSVGSGTAPGVNGVRVAVYNPRRRTTLTVDVASDGRMTATTTEYPAKEDVTIGYALYLLNTIL